MRPIKLPAADGFGRRTLTQKYYILQRTPGSPWTVDLGARSLLRQGHQTEGFDQSMF
jgi:hypothetical protein